MRFLQFYFALPIAMVVLSVTLVPFFHNARVFTAYEYLERRFDAKTRTLTAFLFLISRAHGERRGDLGAGGGAVGDAGLERHHDVPADGAADGDLHDVRRRAGGGLDRRQADGADRRSACWRRWSCWSSACPTASAWATRCSLAGTTGRLQTFDFRFDLTDRYTFWSGTIAALVPVLLVLRHRPEPGAALPHGEVGRRGAHLAADERLLEDSAAGAGAAHRRADVRVLRLHAAADAVQHRARRRRCAASARAGRVRGRRSAVRDRRSRPSARPPPRCARRRRRAAPSRGRPSAAFVQRHRRR